MEADEDIAKEFRDFYTQLYREEPQVCPIPDSYLQHTPVTALNKHNLSLLEEPIRIEEVIGAISRLKPLKSPGPDRFSSGFYKTFCPILAPILVRLFNSFSGPGSIPKEMLEASVVVLPKPGKDPTKCSSYRTISLLNVDLKLFTGILAHRLGPMMPGIIEPDQSGFIQNRQCNDNTKRTFHLIDKAHKTAMDAVLLTVDAEKAFDRVNWHFWGKTLIRFGLGDRFRAWIHSCYDAPRASI